MRVIPPLTGHEQLSRSPVGQGHGTSVPPIAPSDVATSSVYAPETPYWRSIVSGVTASAFRIAADGDRRAREQENHNKRSGEGCLPQGRVPHQDGPLLHRILALYHSSLHGDLVALLLVIY